MILLDADMVLVSDLTTVNCPECGKPVEFVDSIGIDGEDKTFGYHCNLVFIANPFLYEVVVKDKDDDVG